MPTKPVIQIRELQKRFGSVDVLKGLSFDIFEGEIFGFLGINGAGKSTTINILTDQISADDGWIEIAGNPVGKESNRTIGVAPQDIALYPRLSVRENLHFFAGVYGSIGLTRRRQVDRALDIIGLRSVSHVVAERLSGGWQRRLNLAVALVHQPHIAILDEATVGMDVEARLAIWEVLRALKSNGITILLSTHMMDEAEAICDRIGILQAGRIAALGTIEELRCVVPAAQLAEVESSDLHQLLHRAKASNFQIRNYAGRTTLLLPEQLTLGDLIDRLAPLEIQSARLRDITLSDVFLEIASIDRSVHETIDQRHP